MTVESATDFKNAGLHNCERILVALIQYKLNALSSERIN